MIDSTEAAATPSKGFAGGTWTLVLVGTGALLWAAMGALTGPAPRPPRPAADTPAVVPSAVPEMAPAPGLVGTAPDTPDAPPMHTPAPTRPAPPRAPEEEPASVGLGGQVVDAMSREPIPGVRVFLMPSGPNGVAADFSAVSDAHGSFFIELKGASTSVVHPLVAVASGYVPLVLDTPSLAEPNVLELSVGAAISGQVKTPLGDPVVGIRVVAHARRHIFGWPHSEEWLSSVDPKSGGAAVTSEDGSFRVAGLVQDSEYTIYAAKEGYERTSAYWPLAVAPNDGVEIVLQPVASTRLRVVDAKTGAPVRRYAVSIGGGEGFAEFVRSSTRNVEELDLSWITNRKAPATDADPEKNVSLEITALGYETKALQAKALTGRLDEVLIKLEPSEGYRRVRFRVSDEAGTPVAGEFQVVVGDIAFGQFLALQCDKSGRSQSVLAPVGRTRVWVKGGGVSTRWYVIKERVALTIPSTDEDPSDLTLDLKVPGRQFKMQVVTQSGASCRGYSLSIVRRGSPILGDHSFHWDLPANEYLKSSGRTWSASDLPSVLLPPGEWTVTANRAGVGMGSTDVRSASMSAAGIIRVVLDPAAEWRPDQLIKKMLRAGR